MTSRWADMEARSSQRWSPRLLCVVAGLLCAVGVLSGAVLHAGGGAHHHAHAIAAVATVADGHGTMVRGDHQVVATASATTAHARLHTAVANAPAASLGLTSIDSVRTRGPPAAA